MIFVLYRIIISCKKIKPAFKMLVVKPRVKRLAGDLVEDGLVLLDQGFSTGVPRDVAKGSARDDD
jgi:hypothetical protein